MAPNTTASILVALVLACRPSGEPAPERDAEAGARAGPPQPAPEPPRDADHDRLTALFDEYWAWELEQYPILATHAGVHDYDDQLGSVTPATWEARASYCRELLDRLAQLDRSALAEPDRVNAEILERKLRATIADVEFRDYEMPLTSDDGFHSDFARLPIQHPFATVADYDNYLLRLGHWPRLLDEHITNMRAGLARGFTPPKVVLEGQDGTIAAHVVTTMEDSRFFEPFTRFPDTIPAAERERLREAGLELIAGAIVPSYSRLLEFFTTEYRPGARESLGASELPDGRAYYVHKVRYYTTLDLEPEAIHQIGLDEVARIRAQMQVIMDELEFAGSFAEFLEFLRTDPRFYATTPEQLLREAAYIAKTMDGELPALFGRLPRQPYTVVPVPDHLAPTYTAGRYDDAPIDGTEPGKYLVNTYDLSSRPLYNLPALTLHEAVPGHHLQIALATEHDDQPAFRRFDYISAYGEGWGLYAEYLGVEAGIYTTPYEHFGRLTYEMWRACRLVVDTGVHLQGWSRQQVIDYLAQNTALSMREIQTETDRYISWPGQALSYKLGELEIKRLRERAETELGQRFDLRGFHDAVLANGSVPLPVLERSIERWIVARLHD